jgi:hypothetical protein
MNTKQFLVKSVCNESGGSVVELVSMLVVCPKGLRLESRRELKESTKNHFFSFSFAVASRLSNFNLLGHLQV